MRTDASTKEYVTKRHAQGKKRTEIIRCLKRHIAPQIYRLIINPQPTPDCARLRRRRQQAHITATETAQALGTYPSRISALELGRDHNHHLANPIPELAPNPPPGPTNADLTTIGAS